MIKDILLWALSKFSPTEEQKVEDLPFPVPEKKPRKQVKKATTRKPAAKKATTVVKKTTKAKAK